MEQTELKYLVFGGDNRKHRCVHIYSPKSNGAACNAHGTSRLVFSAARVMLTKGWTVCAKCVAHQERQQHETVS